MSCFTISMTNGRGLIVSRLPLGICSTRLIVLGTAVTIREPRSTLRVSHFVSSSLMVASAPSFSRRPASAERGAKCATCAVVV